MLVSSPMILYVGAAIVSDFGAWKVSLGTWWSQRLELSDHAYVLQASSARGTVTQRYKTSTSGLTGPARNKYSRSGTGRSTPLARCHLGPLG